MTFLNEPFKYDAFVSYAHGRGGRLKEWSESLVEELEKEIKDFRTEFDEIDIFMDPDLDETEPLTDQIEDSVKSSALLLIIMTQRYLESRWCQDERDWFKDQIQRYYEAGGDVLVVRAQATTDEDWPECLKDKRGHVLTGFQFHPQPDRKQKDPRPYGYPRPNSEDREFFKALTKLVTRTIDKLEKIKSIAELRADEMRADQIRAGNQRSDRPRPDAPVRTNGAATLFLHVARPPVNAEPEVKQQTRQAWQLAKTALTNAGYEVLPEQYIEITKDLSTFRQVKQQLTDALAGKASAVCFQRLVDNEATDKELARIDTQLDELRDYERSVPLAIIDFAGSASSLADELDLHTIDATADSWVDEIDPWLETVAPAEEE